jgi:hypothetical protein
MEPEATRKDAIAASREEIDTIHCTNKLYWEGKL